MKYKIFLLTLLLAAFNVNSSYGQVWLPGDTIVSCNSGLIIHAVASPLNIGSGEYLVSSVPFDSVYFSGIGSNVSTNYDDNCSDTIDIPFNFSFFEELYNKATIGGNGYLSFDLSLANQFSPWSFSSSVPSASLPLNSIFGVYHDIDLSVGGNIFFRIEGISPNRKFIVEFHNVPQFSCNSNISSTAIVLYETNIIEIHVLSKPVCSSWNSGNALLAIQNGTGNFAYYPPGRNTGPWSASHEAWRFTPSAPCDSFDLQWYINGVNAGIGDSLNLSNVDSLTLVRVEMISYCSGQALISSADEMQILSNSTMVATPSDTSICFGKSLQLSISGVSDAIWSTGDTTLLLQLTPATDTTLYAQSYNSGSCTQYTQTHIIVNPVPVKPIVVFDDSLFLLVSDISGIQWFYNDSVIEVPVSDTLSVTANGSYYALNFNEFGCSSSSDTVLVTNVSLQEQSEKNDFVIWPNPSNGVLSIKCVNEVEHAVITVVNPTGQKITTAEFSGDRFEMDLRSYISESGLLFVTIDAGSQGVIHTPVIIIH
ncbi:hypothetical protein SDC9_56997 [bioreactor metagenome]|uniref:Secretion system C-terminal sorting domain-containing protein n=1 Tax=bioreactor metagenome TaxID=1076179 RepID=A0A644X8S0_9ZZZZ